MRFGEAIDRIGKIEREIDSDFFGCSSHYRSTDFYKDPSNNLAENAG